MEEESSKAIGKFTKNQAEFSAFKKQTLKFLALLTNGTPPFKSDFIVTQLVESGLSKDGLNEIELLRKL